MYKGEDFKETNNCGEFLYIHKTKEFWFGRFPSEETYYIPYVLQKFDTKEEVINYLNKI